MSDVRFSDRNYRRGAVMGLTMAEAFILIAFALLLLFAFWQWEVAKENTPDVRAFRDLPDRQRQTVLTSAQDGSLSAFVSLKEKGMDFSMPANVENPQEKWRFIDKDEMRRLMDAATELPEDIRRKLADMVEAGRAREILRQMAVLERLVEFGKSPARMIEIVRVIDESGRSVEELTKIAGLLAKTGKSTDELLEAGRTLTRISGKDKDEMRRLMDAATRLPEDIQRKLANMVEAGKTRVILKQTAILERLIEFGKSPARMIEIARAVDESGRSVEELTKIAELLAKAGKSTDELLEAGRTLTRISGKDKDEMRRLMDVATELPEDIQRKLADMVEAGKVREIFKQMAVLERLIELGKSPARMIEIARAVDESGRSVEELTEIAGLLAKTGKSTDELLEAVRALAKISGKIRDAEDQRETLVGALRLELGGVVDDMGGRIDDSGAIILPDRFLFDQGRANITPVLRKSLAEICRPWLSVLRSSGVNISEVKIEGHASSEWRRGSSPRDAYLGNLDLSQRRALVVLRTCLDFVKKQPELLDWARRHMIAVGYSSVRRILKNGDEDRTASRRVVFSATPNRKSLLKEIETNTGIAGYDRSLFGGRGDAEEGCRDMKQEMLQALSTDNVSFARDRCTVAGGRWKDPYTGTTVVHARDMEIDYLVPLKWAWDRGAHSWPSEKRADFANDYGNLIVVARSAHREKGEKGPLNWLPPHERFRCRYVKRFEGIVRKYKIELSARERTDMNEVRDSVCN